MIRSRRPMIWLILASAPLHVGPFENEYSFVGVNCDGFDINIRGAGTDERAR